MYKCIKVKLDISTYKYKCINVKIDKYKNIYYCINVKNKYMSTYL